LLEVDLTLQYQYTVAICDKSDSKLLEVDLLDLTLQYQYTVAICASRRCQKRTSEAACVVCPLAPGPSAARASTASMLRTNAPGV
jgi:hypothetical protein